MSTMSMIIRSLSSPRASVARAPMLPTSTMRKLQKTKWTSQMMRWRQNSNARIRKARRPDAVHLVEALSTGVNTNNLSRTILKIVMGPAVEVVVAAAVAVEVAVVLTDTPTAVEHPELRVHP